MRKFMLGSLVGLSVLASTATAALSHAVQTDYFVDLFSAELSLSFTSTFSTGEPMGEATVLVYAPGEAETPWLESQTDEAGQFTFLPDESLKGNWRIEFEKAGHQDIWIVPVGADGIDYGNISQGGSADVHYAGATPAAIALIGVLGLGAIAIAIKRQPA